MISRSLGHRAPLLWLVLPMIGGMVAARSFRWDEPAWQLAGALVLAAASGFAGRRAPRCWAVLLVAAMLLAGGATYARQRAWLPEWESLPPREVRLSLRLERVFAPSVAGQVSGLGSIVHADTHLRDLERQRVHFSLTLPRGQSAPIRSAVISVVGVLATLPRAPPADSFEGYLANAGVNFRLRRGRVVAESAPASDYHRFCHRAAGWFHEFLGRGIAAKRPALAGLLRAMMLGWKHELSEEQHRLFMESGTMHLFAISGLHIGVIAIALDSLLRLLRLPARVCFGVGTGLLWLFVDITGASSSAVRAFIMATFLRGAPVLHRPGNPLAALAASALFVLLLTPLQAFGASFLMSYGIVLALFLLGLPLGETWQVRWALWRDLPKATWRRWQHLADGAWRQFLIVLAIGFATTLVSLLTGVQFFQLLTPGALVTNLAIIPAAMLATVGGFGAIVCGLAGFDTGNIICTHAAALTMLLIEAVVAWSVQWPGAFLPARFIGPWIGMTALALLIGTMLAGYATHWRGPGGWWPPFALVAATLALGTEPGP